MRNLEKSDVKSKILEVSREFKKRRLQQNLTQKNLSKKANISQSIIAKLEQGSIDPTYSTILKIESALFNEEKVNQLEAKDIMTTEIISITTKVTISKALEIMRENDFSQILVIEKEIPLGIIYEKSILDAITQRIDIYKTQVKKFMEPTPIIVHPKTPSSQLSSIFSHRNNLCILVMENQRLQGIITKSDLFK